MPDTNDNTIFRSIPQPKRILLKLPPYYTMFSIRRSNGVFVFNRAGRLPAHANLRGPKGFDDKADPVSGGYAYKGLLGFIPVWNAGKAFITYSEAIPETEAQWLRVAPISDRTLAGFMKKLVKAAHTHPDEKIKKLAQHTLDDMGLEEEFLLGLAKRSKARRLNPKDEDKLAQRLNNPKRGNWLS